MSLASNFVGRSDKSSPHFVQSMLDFLKDNCMFVFFANTGPIHQVYHVLTDRSGILLVVDLEGGHVDVGIVDDTNLEMNLSFRQAAMDEMFSTFN